MELKQEMLKECFTNYLLDQVHISKSIKEQLTILEYEKFQTWIKKLDYDTAATIVLGEQDESKRKRIYDKIRKYVDRYGWAVIAGGYIGALTGGSVGAHTADARKAGKRTAIGTAIGAAVGITLSIALAASLQKYKDICWQKCDKIADTNKRKICEAECWIVAISKEMAELNSARAHCKDTEKPEKCIKGINRSLAYLEKQLGEAKSRLINLRRT